MVAKGEGCLGDPYFRHVEDQWPHIMELYAMCEDRHPVMLFDIEEQKIYVYNYQVFQEELSPMSQEILKDQFFDALATSKLVIFVRDNVNRRLVSYAVPLQTALGETGSKPPKVRRQSKVRGQTGPKKNAEPGREGGRR